MPNIWQPHLEIDRRGRRSRDDTPYTTYVHGIFLVGYETGGVSTSGYFGAGWVMDGGGDTSARDGEKGDEGCAWVWCRSREWELESG